MREIKFRGKDRNTGEWFYGNYYDKDTKGNTHICNQYKGSLVIAPETVGQFTGLYDKNGKEIYDGDICRMETGRCSHFVYMSVEWNMESAAFGFRLKGETYIGCSEAFRRWIAEGRVEVIGNIHDNPELIN